jgi:hypothetical protein
MNYNRENVRLSETNRVGAGTGVPIEGLDQNATAEEISFG